ncbi:MAG: DEAD/DEAH box helicase, partial [Actinomycetaceae bacterium]|nr:DEAD/DEAH box helicase [Actinomycetaceae bacterium]
MEVLDRFGEATRQWFTGAFDCPTPAQVGAWQAISQGRNALVIAPTGSGKTLAAFLWAIDRLFRDKGSREGEGRTAGNGGAVSNGAAGSGAASRGAGNRRRGEDSPTATPGRGRSRAAPGPDVNATARTQILYISPLKALGVDVERNLRVPLAGIVRVARQRGLSPPEVRVGVRSGDTTSSQRQRLIRKPPDILITTPESLYLMLTSRARQTLSGVHTVIVDEVHALAGSKRGAHLAVSLERLDGLLAAPAQRIGLSATVRPVEEVARFLGGAEPVDVVAGQAVRDLDLTVTVPVADLRNLPAAFEEGAEPPAASPEGGDSAASPSSPAASPAGGEG